MNEAMLKEFTAKVVLILTASDAHKLEDVGANIKELQNLANRGAEPEYTVYPLEGQWDLTENPFSFHKMKQFILENNYAIKTLVHREIYISDVRKTERDKLKTVLRYRITENFDESKRKYT
jgi:hypothetical protein